MNYTRRSQSGRNGLDENRNVITRQDSNGVGRRVKVNTTETTTMLHMSAASALH